MILVESNILNSKEILKIYQIEQKTYLCQNDEWYIYHSVLSWYVSDLTVPWKTRQLINQWLRLGFWFNATFNNISVILWRSVLLVEETEVPRENHQPAASHW
jgi:hypothetical protein